MRLDNVLSLLLTATFVGHAQVVNESVRGRVLGEGGTPVVGATVTLVAIQSKGIGPVRRPTSQIDRYAASTGADGAFRFDNLRIGDYLLCAQAPSTEWLSSCEWGGKPVKVSVPQAADAVTLTMRIGGVVSIRVDDPTGALSQHQGKTPGAHVLLGVSGSDQLFRVAVLASEDAGGRNYRCIVPYDASMKLVFSSTFFQLADGQGSPLQSKTTVIPVTARAQQAPPSFRVLVTGIRAQ